MHRENRCRRLARVEAGRGGTRERESWKGGGGVGGRGSGRGTSSDIRIELPSLPVVSRLGAGDAGGGGARWDAGRNSLLLTTRSDRKGHGAHANAGSMHGEGMCRTSPGCTRAAAGDASPPCPPAAAVLHTPLTWNRATAGRQWPGGPAPGVGAWHEQAQRTCSGERSGPSRPRWMARRGIRGTRAVADRSRHGQGRLGGRP